MNTEFFLLCLLLKVVQSQLNGEFWWLNEKVAKYNRALITPPMIEELSEFDNDDNVNIVFQDQNAAINSAKDNIRNQKISPTETVRLNSINQEIDAGVVWPVQNKHSNGSNNILIENHLETTSRSTTHVVNMKNFNENLPFLFPDSSSYRRKTTFQTMKNNISKSTVELMSNPVNLVTSSVNKDTEDRIFHDRNQTRFIFDDRPKFSNVNVEDMKIFEKNRQFNKSLSNVKMDIETTQIINLASLSSSTPMNNKINKYKIDKNDFNDSPKVINDFVTNIKSNNLDFNNKITIGGGDNKVATFTDQLQSATNVSNLDFLYFDTTTNHPVYKNINKNYSFAQRPEIGNVNVKNIRNDKVLWPKKNSQLSELSSKGDYFVFGKPSRQLSKPNIVNFNSNNNKEIGIQFNFPKRDKIVSENTSAPTSNTNFINKNSQNLSIFQNGEIGNKNWIWMNEAKPSQVQTNYTFSNQNNVYTLKDKMTEIDRTTSTTKSNKISFSPFSFANEQVLQGEKKEPESQSICTYIKEEECRRKKGYIYTVELQIMLAKKAHDPNLICCILPTTNNNDSEVSFVRNPNNARLQKRSTSDDETDKQKQRNILLERLLSQSINTKVPVTQSKIVVPDDDYSDPYWNVKNSKFQEKSATRNDGTNKDYIEDYADELPKPGLLGMHSNTAQKRNPTWQFINRRPETTYGVDVVYDSVESDEAFGYSSIDPRRVVNSKPKIRRPQKLTTVPNENPNNPESQIISFKSNPDFKVFQGFKLTNYAKNKNVNTKTLLTYAEDGSESNESEDNFSEAYIEATQIYKKCGRTVQIIKRDRKNNQAGETENGSHPWLGLVVKTKRRFNVLCYATIIHPRIAITAAECVSGTHLGEITLIAGLWNLNERARLRSRVVSTHVHSEFAPGDLTNNVALLHWQQPLRLGINVQPACLASHDFENSCIFYGWGGFEEEIYPRSRWQKATIKECKKDMFPNAESESEYLFCASVQSHNMVIGNGSPLTCKIDGRQSMVGFVVYHKDMLILLSPEKWAKQAVKKLHLI